MFIESISTLNHRKLGCTTNYTDMQKQLPTFHKQRVFDQNQVYSYVENSMEIPKSKILMKKNCFIISKQRNTKESRNRVNEFDWNVFTSRYGAVFILRSHDASMRYRINEFTVSTRYPSQYFV